MFFVLQKNCIEVFSLGGVVKCCLHIFASLSASEDIFVSRDSLFSLFLQPQAAVIPICPPTGCLACYALSFLCDSWRHPHSVPHPSKGEIRAQRVQNLRENYQAQEPWSALHDALLCRVACTSCVRLPLYLCSPLALGKSRNMACRH